MIGSHNSLSYLPVRKWWMYLLKPWSKCQDKDIVQQYIEDVSYFDIRIKFDKDGNVLFVHNNIIYDITKEKFFNLWEKMEVISMFNPNALPLYCRIMLDVRHRPRNKKDRDRNEILLNKFLQEFQEKFTLTTVDDVRIYYDWNNPVRIPSLEMVEKHTSVCSKWYEYILGTKWWARKHNPALLKDFNNDKMVLLIDYV